MNECDPKELKAIPNEQAKDSLVPPTCPPETKLPIPDELRENTPQSPQKEPQTQTQELTPKPLLLRNRSIEVTCAEPGTYGDAVSVADGTLTDLVYFSSVPAITSSVLEYIAAHELEDTIADLWHAGTLNSTTLHTMTGMTIEQARALLQKLRLVQDQLDNISKQKAQSLLQCYWINEQQTADCDDTQMARDGTYAGITAIFSHTVESGQVRSYVSQEDANAQAQQLAESMLNCFYINDACTATCETRPDRPADIVEHVPNDLEPIYPGLGLRVGTYIIEAGAYVSYNSKEDANEQASDAAYSMLSCWYPNLAIEAECERDENGEIPARNMWVDPKKEPPKQADIHARTVGQIVSIPVGFFTSDYSTDMATQEAEELAASLLECCFINEEIEVFCDVDTLETDTCETFEVEANPEKGLTSYKVERGAFASCVSQEEANEFARQSAADKLECLYCNVAIMPTCVPDWVIKAIREKRLTLPLNSDTITDGEYSIKVSALPPEATLGAAAGTFCAFEAQQAQDLAEAASKANSSDVCIYYNDEVVIACSSEDPYGGGDVEGMKLYYRTKPDTGEAYYFTSMYSPDKCLSPLSTPVAGEIIVIPAGLYSGPDKTLLDAKALEFGLQSRSCIWQNPLTEGACGITTAMTNICTPWTVGKDLGYPQSRLHRLSNTRTNPIHFAAGIVTVTGYGNDENSILTQIRASVKSTVESMIMCVYGNEACYSTCDEVSYSYESYAPKGAGLGWEKTTSVTTMHNGFVPAMFLFADTPIEADQAAEDLVKNMAACNQNTDLSYYCVLPVPTPSPSPTPPPTPPPIQPPQPSDEEEPCCWWTCPLYGSVPDSGTSYKGTDPVLITVLQDKLSTMETNLNNLENE